MKSVLIIGYGVVGKNVHKLFEKQDVQIYDPACVASLSIDMIKNKKFDIGFICVPTDKLNDGSCDTSIVQDVIEDFRDCCDVLCIRSTVSPGFTEEFSDICVFQPEYYGGTQHANDNNYDYIILGGKRNLTDKVAEVYKEIYPARLRIFKTTSRTAEIVKYMENSWLAAKVTFCNEFYRLCNTLKVDYDEVREMWLADPRINPSHTFVYRDHPFYKSHCLDKDIPAIIKAAQFSGFDMPLMSAVNAINEKNKAEHDSR